jgi:hypothetical protein
VLSGLGVGRLVVCAQTEACILRQLAAEVIALDEDSGIATPRFLDDSSRREVSVPEMIYVAVGMPVKVIDIANDTPIYGWGPQPPRDRILALPSLQDPG